MPGGIPAHLMLPSRSHSHQSYLPILPGATLIILFF